MDVRDPVYGEFSIREGVIQELIESRPVQRLRMINQAGALRYVDPNRFVNTRFGHSLGVYYILRKYGASLEEQVAGLLHDVSHTAFSHVSDYLFEGGQATQDYHEKLKRGVLVNSEIPAILRSHGMGLDSVLDERRFGMLEKGLPDICADRLDYFFRDAVVYGLRPDIRHDVALFMSALRSHDGEFVFTNIEVARRAAEAYMECNRLWWSGPVQAASCRMLADAIKAAMGMGELDMKDLLLTDDEVYARLKTSKSPEARKLLDGLSRLKCSAGGPEGGKLRFIDPKVLQNGRAKRLSEYDSGYRELVGSYSKRWK